MRENKSSQPSRVQKAAVVQTWEPFLIHPCWSGAYRIDEPFQQLPGFEECQVLKRSQDTAVTMENPELRRFFNKGYQDGSIESLSMITTMKIVGGDNDFPTNSIREYSVRPKESLDDNNFLVEGWPLIQDKISWESCKMLYRFVYDRLHMVTLPHPLTEYGKQTILFLSQEEFEKAVELAHQHKWIPRSTSNRLQASQMILDYVTSLPPRIMGVLLESPLSKVVDKTPELHQSCLPNACLELQPSQNSEASVTCSLVALYDLEPNEEYAISTRPAPTSCDCGKCEYRGDPKSLSKNSSDWFTSAQRLAHTSFQQEEYERSRDLYRLCYEGCDTEDGDLRADLWHSMAAVDLASLKFVAAQRHWKEGSQFAPIHSGIALQLEKQRSYRYFEPLPAPSTAALPKYETVSHRRLHVVPKMVNDDTCRQIIKWANEQGSEEGWTTSRHYAVPTTDIPVHLAPKVLDWFVPWIETDLQSMLREQFQAKPNQRFYVHDAFVVRYASSSTSHFLPLHYDESTHSAVIALNDEFEGGGTYFYNLDQTMTPKMGTVATFRGNQLLHGGNVVTKGVRYILAIFLYLDEDTSSSENVSSKDSSLPSPKRAKTADDGAFSFSFF